METYHVTGFVSVTGIMSSDNAKNRELWISVLNKLEIELTSSRIKFDRKE